MRLHFPDPLPSWTIHIQGSAPSSSRMRCILSLGCWHRAPALAQQQSQLCYPEARGNNSLPDSLIRLTLTKMRTPHSVLSSTVVFDKPLEGLP